jgi:hypothetical protein
MNRFAPGWLCVVMLCWFAVPQAALGEKIDNPEYKHWAQFKPGSYCVTQMKQTVIAGPMEMKTEVTTTTTLKTLTAEKAVIEVKTVMVADGHDVKMEPMTHEIPAKIDKPKETKPADKKTEEVKVKEGEEELTIAGKKIKTKWAKTTLTVAGRKTETTTWISEEVPGRIVKTVTKIAGEEKMAGETKLIKFKAIKK